MDEAFWAEVCSIESRVRSDIVEVSSMVASHSVIQQRLVAVQKGLDQLEQMMRSAELEAAVAPSLAEGQKVKERVEAHRREVGQLRTEMRSGKAAMRNNVEKHMEREREELMRGWDKQGTPSLSSSSQRTALRSAEKGTAALREAEASMRREVERMQAARLETEETSKLQEDALQQHRSLEGGVQTGRRLVTRLARREQTDKMLLAFATAVFFLVVAYVILK